MLPFIFLFILYRDEKFHRKELYKDSAFFQRYSHHWLSLVAQWYRICLPKLETRVESPGLRITPGEENGNSLQYSCLGNPMDRGAWWVTIHGVAKESDATEQQILITIHLPLLEVF